MSSFTVRNIDSLSREATCAHGGVGEIDFRRVADPGDYQSACNFIDLAILPPGTSIGRHRHAENEEEFYLVLDGSGLQFVGGEEVRVSQGDLIRNPPGGEHGLVNDTDAPLKIFVFEMQVRS